MIDIENEVNTVIFNAVQPSYPNAAFESELDLTPSVFPCICVEEIGNASRTDTADTKSNENHANVTYEINIFTNKTSGKRTQARAILSLIDNALLVRGFERDTINPIPLDSGTKYRLVARYSASVSANKRIYGR